uniref:Uncharacterized protein n=1 Tax=Arundo donax TaxID=35708 RepID=A0A0A8YDI6_ARUDO
MRWCRRGRARARRRCPGGSPGWRSRRASGRRRRSWGA